MTLETEKEYEDVVLRDNASDIVHITLKNKIKKDFRMAALEQNGGQVASYKLISDGNGNYTGVREITEAERLPVQARFKDSGDLISKGEPAESAMSKIAKDSTFGAN